MLYERMRNTASELPRTIVIHKCQTASTPSLMPFCTPSFPTDHVFHVKQKLHNLFCLLFRMCVELGPVQGEKNTLFGNEVQREIFGPKRREVKED